MIFQAFSRTFQETLKNQGKFRCSRRCGNPGDGNIMRPIANILVKRAPILPPSGGNIGNSNEFKPKYIKIELEAIEYYAGRKEILLAGISRSMHIIAS